MTDLRARLAVALLAAADELNLPEGLDLEAVADVLLSLPDIAIVELPRLTKQNFADQYWITFHPDGIRWTNDKLGATPELTREFAAALLAAANAAEVKT